MHRLLLSVVAGVSLLIVACGSTAESPPPTTRVTNAPVAAGSPQAATPTAMLAVPAPTASPLPSPSPASVAANPSPVANGSPVAAGPYGSPAAVASPAAANPSGSPVAAVIVTPAAPGGQPGPVYRIVGERSEASYHARETFANRPGLADAVGRTNELEGEIQLESAGVLRGRVLLMRIDMRTLTSDQSRRDNFIRQNTLQTDQFPFAEFRSTEAAGPAVFRPGEEAAFQIPGVMTIKGRERPIVWEARATLDGNTITGTATAKVKLSDYGVEPPRLAILSVEDEMTWQVDIVAERDP